MEPDIFVPEDPDDFKYRLEQPTGENKRNITPEGLFDMYFPTIYGNVQVIMGDEYANEWEEVSIEVYLNIYMQYQDFLRHKNKAAFIFKEIVTYLISTYNGLDKVKLTKILAVTVWILILKFNSHRCPEQPENQGG